VYTLQNLIGSESLEYNINVFYIEHALVCFFASTANLGNFSFISSSRRMIISNVGPLVIVTVDDSSPIRKVTLNKPGELLKYVINCRILSLQR